MSDVIEVTPEVLRAWPLPLDSDGDKHSRGSVLVVGGSAQTPGAVLLAGLAALRVGAGKLQLATVASAAPGLALTVPEALVEALTETGAGTIDLAATDRLADRLHGADAVLVGPGLQGIDEVSALVEGVLGQLDGNQLVVLDAYAFVCLPSCSPTLLEQLHGRLVLTPNPGEVLTLLGDDAPDDPDLTDPDRLAELSTLVAERYGAAVATRGLVVAPGGRQWRDAAGGIGLGTSGSGDVLAGLAAGAAARCGDAAQAAVWATHLHGAAGDRLSERLGAVGYLARELLDEVPQALAALS